MTWRLVRQVVLLMTVAAMGVVAPALASSTDGDPVVAGPGPTIYRVELSPASAAATGPESEFVATVSTSADAGASWRPAAGEQLTFAYVTDGAGTVVAVNGAPAGSMSCATDAAGHCTVAVRTEAPGEAVVTATAGGQSASVLLP